MPTSPSSIAAGNAPKHCGSGSAAIFAFCPWDERNAALGDAGLLVNTTMLGMHGQPELALAVERLPAHAIVSDLVYVPLITPLLEPRGP